MVPVDKRKRATCTVDPPVTVTKTSKQGRDSASETLQTQPHDKVTNLNSHSKRRITVSSPSSAESGTIAPIRPVIVLQTVQARQVYAQCYITSCKWNARITDPNSMASVPSTKNADRMHVIISPTWNWSTDSNCIGSKSVTSQQLELQTRTWSGFAYFKRGGAQVRCLPQGC
jgi:hypothetical protein